MHQQIEVFDHAVHVRESNCSAFFSSRSTPTKSMTRPTCFWMPSLSHIGPVHARDGLKQDVIPHRLVEIQAVEQRRVVAGEKLVGDDEDFRVFVGLLEQQADIVLAFLGELKFGHKRPIHHVGCVLGIDGLCPFRRQQLVERLFVLGAGLAIDRDHKRLVAERQHVLLEVLGDERRHLRRRDRRPSGRCAGRRRDRDLVQLVDVGDAFGVGELEELLIQPVGRNGHLARRHDVLDRQGRLVLDRFLDRVLVEVALLVLCAENLERARPWSVLAIGVPVKPMMVAFGTEAMR